MNGARDFSDAPHWSRQFLLIAVERLVLCIMSSYIMQARLRKYVTLLVVHP